MQRNETDTSESNDTRLPEAEVEYFFGEKFAGNDQLLVEARLIPVQVEKLFRLVQQDVLHLCATVLPPRFSKVNADSLPRKKTRNGG